VRHLVACGALEVLTTRRANRRDRLVLGQDDEAGDRSDEEYYAKGNGDPVEHRSSAPRYSSASYMVTTSVRFWIATSIWA
jgi:hypothetical protein